ncbi:MAG: hypothetical protein KIT31_07770 [Deltaproteobacteria bacterium]|nr:hypothetical protein [Deltaproteobacteria bacterium]
MPRAPGKIIADGPRDVTDALVAALRAPSLDHDIALSLTHPFHTYPARLHPATARILVDVVAETIPNPGRAPDRSRDGRAGGGTLDRTAPGRSAPDRSAPDRSASERAASERAAPVAILDPFCGSGTVLVEAAAAELPAVGVDLNPLATLVARAKTWLVPPHRRRKLREAAHAIAGGVLAAGKAARRAAFEPMPRRRPTGFDPNARDRRLAAWFAPHVRRELEALAAAVDDVERDDAELGGILLACLSAILYKVSSRTSDTDGTWVDRDIARGQACRLFAQRADLLSAGLDDLPPRPRPRVVEADARTLGTAGIVPDGTAGGVVTSPPYAGTYDYAEHQRLRFDFLALHHRDFDAGEIGARRSFDQPREGSNPTAAWRTALADTLHTLGRALAPGARAAIVIGDSLAAGRAMYALDDVRAALTSDLLVEAWASQHRPILGAVERRAFADRPKSEHILLLRRG